MGCSTISGAVDDFSAAAATEALTLKTTDEFPPTLSLLKDFNFGENLKFDPNLTDFEDLDKWVLGKLGHNWVLLTPLFMVLA